MSVTVPHKFFKSVSLSPKNDFLSVGCAVGKDLIFAKRGNLFSFLREMDFGISFCL